MLPSYKKQRSSHRRCSTKKGVLKNFLHFTGKHLCWCLLLIKLKARRPLLKRDSNWCFPVRFAKLLRTPILKNTYERLFLKVVYLLCKWISWLLYDGSSTLKCQLLNRIGWLISIYLWNNIGIYSYIGFRFKVNASRYKQCGVNAILSNLLKKILRNYWYNQ